MAGNQSAGGKETSAALLTSLSSALWAASEFPVENELQLLELTSPAFKKSRKHLVDRVAATIRSITTRYAVASKTTDSDCTSSDDSTCTITPRDHLHEEAYETTEEALEYFNAALDSTRGIQDAVVHPAGALCPNPGPLKIGLGYLGRRQGRFLDIEKPQTHFHDYPVDNSDTPFVSPYSLGTQDGALAGGRKSAHVDKYLQDLFRQNARHDGERRHPYEEEIAAAAAEMAKKKFSEESTMVYLSTDETPSTFVTTEEELFNMTERLSRATEIAVDLENHSMRSFQGFTCLLQISTRREDFVIDALKLRGSINRALAPIFTDETIVKVLHGADNDVKWLERDFGIYIVNMFDTGQAARLLKLPSAALSFLLTKYCDVTNNSKQKFQLADWRQRPLAKEMFEYARSDTHYLLYVYDRVRSELSQSDLLSESWERSAKIAQKRHSKPRYNPDMASYFAAKHGLGFDGHQIRLLEALCKWRDCTAREEDESLIYVAPLHALFGIVRARDAARNVPGLMKSGFPRRKVPPLVFKHTTVIARIVSDALDAKIEVPGDSKGRNELKKSGISGQKAEDGKSGKVQISIVRKHLSIEGIHESAGNGATSITKRKDAIENIEISAVAEVVPVAKVEQLSKCSFFDSDSGSESEAEGNVGHTEIVAETSKEPEKAGKSRGEVEVDGKESGGLERSKSVFDLSDSSDEEDQVNEVQEGRHKAAKITEELTVELGRRAKEGRSVEFETEMETRRKENEQQVVEEKEESGETRLEEEQEEIRSLLESAEKKGGQAKRGRDKKRKKVGTVKETKQLEVFDYSKSVKEIASRSEKKRKERTFDPLEGLKGKRGIKGRSKAKRRRRGEGKSMSFGRES